MKRLPIVATLVGGWRFSALALGAAAKTYPVTGPVLEIDNDMIVVQKGKDRWELARDGSTKVPAGLKVGDKVTIEYRMHATAVEVKASKSESKKK
jgi:hypothetical protein